MSSVQGSNVTTSCAVGEIVRVFEDTSLHLFLVFVEGVLEP